MYYPLLIVFFPEFEQLSFYPLQRVIDAFHMAAQQFRDFLVAFAVHEGVQHLALKIGKHLGNLILNAGEILLADVKIFRVDYGKYLSGAKSYLILSKSEMNK